MVRPCGGSDDASADAAPREPQPGWEGWEQMLSPVCTPKLVACTGGKSRAETQKQQARAQLCPLPPPASMRAPLQTHPTNALTPPAGARSPWLLLALGHRVVFQLVASPSLP